MERVIASVLTVAAVLVLVFPAKDAYNAQRMTRFTLWLAFSSMAVFLAIKLVNISFGYGWEW